jgi:hypothetical protein
MGNLGMNVREHEGTKAMEDERRVSRTEVKERKRKGHMGAGRALGEQGAT